MPRGSKIVSVIMGAYHAAPWIGESLRSILSQELPPGWRLECIVAVDACPETLAAAQAIADTRLGLLYLASNVGTYVAANTAIAETVGDVIARFDADDVMLPGRLHAMLSHLDVHPEIGAVNTTGQSASTDLRTRLAPAEGPWDGVWAYRREAWDLVGGFQPWRCGADSEAIGRAQAAGVLTTCLRQCLMLRRVHADQLTTAAATRIGGQERNGRLASIYADRARYAKGAKPKRVKPTLGAVQSRSGALWSNRVTASLASIPERADGLRRVVCALLPQVDRLNVYLNGWPAVPAWLKHPRLTVATSQKHGDLGDAGKFFWCDGARGYQFTADDDIGYPPDYVSRTLSAMRRHGNAAVLSYHGVQFAPKVETYRASRRVLSFHAQDVLQDVAVHLGGTGVACYHADRLDLCRDLFERPNMADFWLALACQRQGVPIVCPAHAKGWLWDLGCKGPSIWESSRRRTGDRLDVADAEDELARSTPWRLPPLATLAPTAPLPPPPPVCAAVPVRHQRIFPHTEASHVLR